MLFNSFSFALFFPIVFVVYWIVLGRSLRLQNIFLLLASYFFYGCWDWRFLFLLVFSTILDYYSGLKIEDARFQNLKKVWLYASVGINLGFLGIFKYYNFFVNEFTTLLQNAGIHANPPLINVLLPVGISFYTFHGLSYVFDIYKERIQATRNFVDYTLFVSFFPLLVAGPIERATHLLPQIKSPRVFDYTKAKDGLRQILWGLFKKIVIADNCADYVNQIFNQPDTYNGSTLFLGAVLFSFQIYGDFSGYSDIALGTARLLGFELLQNFNFPYFSRDIAEFWRRWHISLSSWFRDYVYIPLGGSQGSMYKKIRNVFAIFLLSGFWHGANWTFIVWGGLNAVFFIPLLLLDRNRSNLQVVAANHWLPSVKETFSMLFTFILVTITWIFFRSPDLHFAARYIGQILDVSLWAKPLLFPKTLLLLILGFLIVEWLGRREKYALGSLESKLPVVLRWGGYLVIVLCLFAFTGKQQQFIYFQF